MTAEAHSLRAGAAEVEITPRDSQFLYGYPYVQRYSTGVHDPLLCSALYLESGPEQRALFLANDIIFVAKASARRIREQIGQKTGMRPEEILISATHTHSGPMTLDYVSNERDPAVPATDRKYVRYLEERGVAAGLEAVAAAAPAEAGLVMALVTGVGTNRRDPAGPSDPEVPVLLVRSADNHRPLACMLVYSMHPTVLHEDSTLVSADFPGATRKILQDRLHCPVLYHTGPAGNQSPRHVTRSNTFEEAERLGGILAATVLDAVTGAPFSRHCHIRSCSRFLDLPRRTLPTVQQSTARCYELRHRLEFLKSSGAPREHIRTAEVDWFGAEEDLTLAQAAEEGRLEKFYNASLPAEIQLIEIGRWAFLGWQGEVFVEYSLEVKQNCRDTYVISLANGELQGYLVTQAAAQEGAYEAANSLFSPEAGSLLVAASLDLVESCRRADHEDQSKTADKN